jgi:hypothetical protein
MRTKLTGILNLVLAANLIFGCGQVTPAEEVGSTTSAIVNGSLHHGHPAVGIMLTGTSLCTVTLVGCKTVLSAAHCLYASDSNGDNILCNASNKPANTSCDTNLGVLRYDKVQIVFGCSNLDNCSADKYFDSTAVYTHASYPGAYPYTADLAVVRLDRAPAVTPLPVTASSPSKGMKLTMVGYGITDYENNDSGTKRVGTTKVDKVESSHFSHEAASGGNAGICSGDSGGPAFATVGGKETVIGVASYGYNPEVNGVVHCGDGYHARLDLSWIKSVSGGDLAVDGDDASCAQADEEKPIVKFISPTADSTILGNPATVELNVEAFDNVAVSNVFLYVDGQYTRSLYAAAGSKNFTATITLDEGKHSLEVVAQDAADNRNSTSVDVVVKDISDTTPPLVTIITPIQGALMNGAVQVLVDISDDVALQQVALYADNGSSALALVQTGIAGKYTLNANLEPGAHILIVQAVDAAGNVATANVQVLIDDSASSAIIEDGATAGGVGQVIGGCSVKDGPVAPLTSLFFLGFLALLRRSRRR